MSAPPLRFGVAKSPATADPHDFVQAENGWYIAGLTDGEGCFYIGTTSCSFTIKLRADDADLLEWVRDSLGVGRVRLVRATGGGQRKPQARFDVTRRDEVLWLTRFFDAFPLLSKKARDYEIWREAAIAWYCGAPPADLIGPKEQLRLVREYSGPVLLAKVDAMRVGGSA